jgi:hypothetical protein
MQGMAYTAKAPAAHQAAHSKTPSNRYRLARGTRLPQAGSAPIEGVRLPRARFASLEGPPRPRTGSASLEGAPYARACSRAGIKCPDIGGTAPSCAQGTRPSAAATTPQEGAHPHHCGEGLCGVAGARPVTPCTCSSTANAPSPRTGAGCTLDLLSCDLAGLGGGARPVGRHPCHC